jgi:hypothetical protein
MCKYTLAVRVTATHRDESFSHDSSLLLPNAVVTVLSPRVDKDTMGTDVGARWASFTGSRGVAEVDLDLEG